MSNVVNIGDGFAREPDPHPRMYLTAAIWVYDLMVGRALSPRLKRTVPTVADMDKEIAEYVERYGPAQTNVVQEIANKAIVLLQDRFPDTEDEAKRMDARDRFPG